jgi:pimeloyl-ACP methyl ester carboxylesterase
VTIARANEGPMCKFLRLTGGLLLAFAALTPGVGAADACDDQFFDAAGVPIRYCVIGTGQPVIVIHGSSGAWAGRVAEAFGPLAERYQLIGFDVRGHGKSGKPHDVRDYGPELVEDVVRLLDHLGLEGAHIVGYSMGGFIGLKLVTVYPDRVRSLVLVGQGILSPTEFAQIADAVEVDDPPERPGDNDPIALAAMIRSYPALAVSERVVRETRVPILAVVGDRDPRVQRASRLQAVLPATRLRVFPGRTHATVLQDPQLIPEIVAFLSRADARQPPRAR